MTTEEAVQFLVSQIGDLKKDGDKIFDSPEGEKSLVEFVKIEKLLEEAKKEISKKLEERGLELDPNFSALKSDNITVNYSYRGAKYELIDPSAAPQEVLKLTLDTKSLDKYLAENELPNGIVEKERTRSCSFRLNKTGAEDEEV